MVDNLSIYLNHAFSPRRRQFIVATRKHPSLEGWRLVICQPIGGSGQPEGAPIIAIDSHGAGMHQQVVISSDGWRRARPWAWTKVPCAGWSPASWMNMSREKEFEIE
jgi:microcompartment protein CcmK/EutM